MGWGVQFAQLVGLHQAFKALSGGFTRDLEDAMEEIVEKIAATAQDTVPVDTGALKATIRSTVRRAGRDFIEGEVSAGGIENVDYAIYVHEGTINRRARPFLVEALNEHKREINSIFQGVLFKVVAGNLAGNTLRRRL